MTRSRIYECRANLPGPADQMTILTTVDLAANGSRKPVKAHGYCKQTRATTGSKDLSRKRMPDHGLSLPINEVGMSPQHALASRYEIPPRLAPARRTLFP